ncbi:Spy/CpxP family protein refolding chaperone [Limnohabitans sp. JirII-29]|uniref:Spy/CpxP family protein refolding chaperone n=1 Tax=Limnohabitans sp. JirII-29 TaxID=1835756 RepID=UPI001304B466|nr:Spy/CpxP family protein refolding chaperone [Limnohabitans sp. JirII-29]
MNRFTPSRLTFATALAGLGLVLSLGAQAQPMGGMGMAGDGMMGHTHMAQRWEARQHELKAKLKLNSSQEPAWNTFVEAMKPSTHPVIASLDREALGKLTTPERMDKMAAFHEAHQAAMQSHMKQRSDATKQFYAQLTAEQQRVFDAETLPRGPRMGRMGQGPASKAN